MKYKIGQFRRPQLDSYYNDFKERITMKHQKTNAQWGDANSIIFQNACGNINSDDYSLKSQKYYYLRFKVKQRLDSVQRFYLKLRYNDETKTIIQEQQQIIDEFQVPMGAEDNWVFFETILAPITTYNQILWQLRRTTQDYAMTQPEPGNELPGRVMNVEIECCAQIVNVINHLKTGYPNDLKGLVKIGVQGPPSLLMCINGEQIRIGKSGIYELNNGIIVSFIGFIPKRSNTDRLDYFIMDFEYIDKNQEEED